MASLPPKTSVKRKKYSFGFSSDNPFVASASSGGDHLKRRPVVRRKSKHKTLDNNEISAIAEKDSRNQMRTSNNRANFFVKTQDSSLQSAHLISALIQKRLTDHLAFLWIPL